jgi:uncharacterized protein (TIGR03435 family)
MSLRISLLLAAAITALAQPRQAFEVATIKVNTSNSRRNVDFGADTLTIFNLPLANILFQAYEVPFDQMSFGAFELLFHERYDIVAKAAQRVRRDQMKLMLQTLLADRFHLAVHHEQKLVQGYALVVDKDGPKLQTPAEPDSEPDFDKRLGPDVPLQTIKFRNAGMGLLALIVREQADTSKIDRLPPPIIVDMTGIKGGFDFTLEWRREDPATADGAPSARVPLLTGALRKVGLTLKSQKVPIDILVVDHIDKAPTEN